MRVHGNCCGLDVHKKIIAACLIREDAAGNSVTEKRGFGSMTRDLRELAQWLCAAQVTAVAASGDLHRAAWGGGRYRVFGGGSLCGMMQDLICR
jgi:hypothetical protein